MVKSQENRDLRQHDLKRCSKCKEIKRLSRFSNKRSTWDGLRSTCRDCDKADHDRYRSVPENREHEAAKAQAWKRRNRQGVSEYNKRYRKEKPNIVRAARRDWHLRHKEKENAISRERMKQWVKDNPERHRDNGRRRHVREMQAEGSHTSDQWIYLESLFNGQCPCCGEKRKLTLDHIIPLNWGGSDYINNIQAICKKCNSTKGDRHDTDYRPEEVKVWADSEVAKIEQAS